MRKLVRLSIVLFISLVLAAPPASLSDVVPFEDPIQWTGHGAAFGVNGQQIDVTADFIAQTQAVYTAHVLESASTSQHILYEQKRAYLDALAIAATLPRELQLALFGRSVLLDWLIDQVAPADATRLKSRNGMLKVWLRSGLGYLDKGETFTLLPSEEALFGEIGVLPAAAVAALPPEEVLQKRETYAKECKKAGVPIPPTWGKTGAGFWEKKGELAAPFISREIKADLWVYQSATPKGVCLALPRHAPGAATPIELLGIICMGQGVATSNACFWDNQLNGVSQPIPQTGQFPLNTNFAAGKELEAGANGPGICTACHAGKNAYIVHPDDPAFGAAGNLKSTGWYMPFMMPGSWPQNPGPDTGPKPGAGESSCFDCHSLPKIDKALSVTLPNGTVVVPYCDAVLLTALNGLPEKKPPDPPPPLPAVPSTMPPKGEGPASDYMTHINYLTKACDDAKK